MTRHPTRSVPALVVVMVALAVALLGSAAVANAAASVTKAQVKKIAKKAATKVIKKSAPDLTVANAGNATNLSGKPASAYLDTATTFVLPTQAMQSTRVYSFAGLAPGTYQVSYNVVMNIGAGFASNCGLHASGSTGLQEGWTYGAQYGGFNTHAATTLLTVTGGPAPQLFCGGADPWSIYTSGDQVSRVTFVPIDSLTTATPPTGTRGTVGKGAAHAR